MTNKIIHKDLGDFEFAEVVIIADMHIGDPNVDSKMIKNTIDYVLAKPYRFLIIAGDIFNAALKTSVSDVYEETMSVDKQMETFVELFAPVAHRILSVVDGNHDRRVTKLVGVDPVRWACNKAGIEYHGNEAQVCVKVGNYNPKAKDRERRVHYLFYVHHGTGAGGTTGAKANKMEKMKAINLSDIYCNGHSHSPIIFPSETRVPDSQYRQFVTKEHWHISVGSALDRAGYAIQMGLPALPKKWATVYLDGRFKSADPKFFNERFTDRLRDGAYA